MRKLNSFIISDSLLQKMNESIKYSKINDIEVGFNLCISPHDHIQIHDELHCKGQECSVDIPKGCKEGNHIGLFHTHTSSIGPSIQDIANAYQIGINCIGSTLDNSINCYSRKEKVPKREDLETIISALIRYEQPLYKTESPDEDIKNYEKWIKVRNEIQKQFLNRIDIL